MLSAALLLLAVYALIGSIIFEVEIGDGVPFARAFLTALVWPKVFAKRRQSQENG
jgi:hypothetical protein